MLIAIDIGNTNIVIGGIQGDAIQFEARSPPTASRPPTSTGWRSRTSWALFGVKPCDVDDCIISSVVPPVFNSVYTGLVKMTGKHPLVVGPGIKTGLNIQMDVPSRWAATASSSPWPRWRSMSPPDPDGSGEPPRPSRWWTGAAPTWGAASSRGCAPPWMPSPPGRPSCPASAWTGRAG